MSEQNFYIGQVFDDIYPPEAAVWCNANNAFIDVIGENRYEIKEIPEPAAPTQEEQRMNRAVAYQYEVDPITCHIQRLRDEEQTEEVIEEIAELIAERDAKVEEIKARFPYPTDPVYEEPTDPVEEPTEE